MDNITIMYEVLYKGNVYCISDKNRIYRPHPKLHEINSYYDKNPSHYVPVDIVLSPKQREKIIWSDVVSSIDGIEDLEVDFEEYIKRAELSHLRVENPLDNLEGWLERQELVSLMNIFIWRTYLGIDKIMNKRKN